MNQYALKTRVRVCGVCVQNDELLMVKHQFPDQKNYLWMPPGGGLEIGESAERGAEREICEESGLIVVAERLLCVYELIKPPLHAIELFFKVNYESGTLKTDISPEMRQNEYIEEVRFVSWLEINEENPDNLHGLFRYARCSADLWQLPFFMKYQLV